MLLHHILLVAFYFLFMTRYTLNCRHTLKPDGPKPPSSQMSCGTPNKKDLKLTLRLENMKITHAEKRFVKFLGYIIHEKD